MRFEANHARMPIQWQHTPVAKVSIQGDQNPPIPNGPVEDLSIVGPRKSDLGDPQGVVPMLAQRFSKSGVEHLIHEQPHNVSGGDQVHRARLGQCSFRKSKGRLDVLPGEFRISGKHGLPWPFLGELPQNHIHRNPGAPDHGPTATDARVELNPVIHVRSIPQPKHQFNVQIPQSGRAGRRSRLNPRV